MKPADIPANEEERLASLRDYQILDTKPERIFDDITQLAASICGVPTALISLIDRDRQWFKSQKGLDGVKETSRDIAFCSHAILDTELMEVPDATQDSRFKDNPLVLGDPKIRFYAGNPLVNARGLALGTLCVIDSQPKQLSESQRAALRQLSELVVFLFEARKPLLRMAQMLEHSLNEIFLFDATTNQILHANHGALRNLGYTLDELRSTTPAKLSDEFSPDRLKDQAAQLTHDAAPGALFETVLKRKNGTRYPVEGRIQQSHERDRTLYVATLNDVSERRRAEERIHLFANALENAAEAVIIMDATRKIVSVNKAFSSITGYSQEEVCGKTPHFLRSVRHDAGFYASIWEALDTEGRWQGEMFRRRKNGEIYPEWVTLGAVKDSAAKTTHYVWASSDISKNKQFEERLSFLTYRDALTQLPNRTLFLEHLDTALKRADRRQRAVGVLSIDLDRFAAINDSLGVEIGDLLLEAVAGRISQQVRQSDLVARLGEDNFVVLMDDLEWSGMPHSIETEGQDKLRLEQALHGYANRLLGAFSKPFRIGGQELFTTASIGVSFYPQDGTEALELLNRADGALHSAKNAGRNTYQFVSPGSNESALQTLRLTNALRKATANNEFELHFQPIVEIHSGAIQGAEALIRWNPPELGPIGPARFIPIAEETGLIVQIGDWVLRTACAQAKAWQDAGIPPFRISVNLSARQFRQEDLAEKILAVVNEAQLDPKWIELEVTETMVMGDPDRTKQVLAQLKERGMTIAIDDFGIGYSSLGYLKHFPVDYLKIDKSFVDNIPGDPDSEAIAQAIIAMAGAMRLKVVAEGIETEAQRAFLADRGCQEGQGYLFSKPLPPGEFVTKHYPGHKDR